MFLRLDENDHLYGKIEIDIEYIKSFDAIIVSDYNKGFLGTKDLEYISKIHPLTFLDTKKILGNWSKNFTFIKINGLEFHKTQHTIDEELLEKLIVTQGQKGCIYRKKRFKVPVVEVKDVSGAGDTFISALCFKFLETRDIEKSIVFANECATKVVQKRGVSVI